MRFVVLGGGCYGTFYARQLLRAADAGAARLTEAVVVDADPACQAATDLPADRRLRLVTRRWNDFLDDFLAGLGEDENEDDMLVPPPFTPHLALAWLLRALPDAAPDVTWSLEPFGHFPDLPFARQAEGGPLLLSHADWICPVHCIEPTTCPATKGPRNWDMSDSAHELAASMAQHGQDVQQVHLFQCHHVTHGVGAYRAASLLQARREMLHAVQPPPARTPPRRFIIGTVSRCHGALNLLRAEIGTDSVSARQAAAES